MNSLHLKVSATPPLFNHDPSPPCDFFIVIKLSALTSEQANAAQARRRVPKQHHNSRNSQKVSLASRHDLSNLAGGAVTWHSDIGFCGPRAYNAEVHADPYHLESPHHHYDLPQHTVPHSWAGPSRVSQDFCAAVVVETPEDEKSLLARQTKNRHGPFAGIRHP